jgi:hypothetical protein
MRGAKRLRAGLFHSERLKRQFRFRSNFAGCPATKSRNSFTRSALLQLFDQGLRFWLRSRHSGCKISKNLDRISAESPDNGDKLDYIDAPLATLVLGNKDFGRLASLPAPAVACLTHVALRQASQ